MRKEGKSEEGGFRGRRKERRVEGFLGENEMENEKDKGKEEEEENE